MNCQPNNCCQMQPIVMPTQVITRRQVSFCEQPIIYPIEYRTLNQVILVPRYYRAYQQPNMPNCTCNCCKEQ